MLMEDRQIIGLPVVTRSGVRVGEVKALQLDIDEHSVKKYIVARGMLPLLKQELLIDPAQVIEINASKMIVLDGELGSVETAAATD